MRDYKNYTSKQSSSIEEDMLTSMMGGLVLIALAAVTCIIALLGAAS
jgi:hypothetical protein